MVRLQYIGEESLVADGILFMSQDIKFVSDAVFETIINSYSEVFKDLDEVITEEVFEQPLKFNKYKK